MYEYDTYQMVGADEFAPRLGRLPDFYPEAEPDDTRTQGDFDAEFEYLFQPQVPEEAPFPAEPPAAPPIKHRRRRPGWCGRDGRPSSVS